MTPIPISMPSRRRSAILVTIRRRLAAWLYRLGAEPTKASEAATGRAPGRNLAALPRPELFV